MNEKPISLTERTARPDPKFTWARYSDPPFALVIWKLYRRGTGGDFKVGVAFAVSEQGFLHQPLSFVARRLRIARNELRRIPL